MRVRSALLALTMVVTSLGFLAPSFAGHGNFQAPFPAQEQEDDFEDAASNASDRSNQPDSFAPCVDGMADIYPCERVDMMSRVPLEELGLSFVNDIWGWTDPTNRKDYALIGGTEGTVIVDISDPKRPDVVGTLPAHTLDPNRPFWRDIKVYDDHMFVGSEQTGHGMQVFDLTEVRGVEGPPVIFTETAHYPGFSNSHNLNINTRSGYAYAVGTNTCEGGLHMVDIGDPTNPTFAGCFDEHGYIHDTQCVIYGGPDRDYRAREICFNSNAEPHHDDPDGIANALSIVDVTDKENPVPLARMEYPNDGYSHQGWLAPGQEFFLHGDELDEVRRGLNTTTRVWDVSDLENPEMTLEWQNDTTSIDHNLYTEGRFTYQSNYTSGLRVLDSSNVDVPELSEVGFFDVYPENDNPTFEGGTWSNYPYFRHRKIVAVSSMDRGLFVLRPRVGAAGN
ncbi:MAG: choice-of-anchor B family protein [Actinomycetota bacterium]